MPPELVKGQHPVDAFPAGERGVDLLLIGASVRALASWFVKAGYRPLGMDLFGDRDLRAICPVRRIAFADWPDGILKKCDDFPGVPIVYGGGLENAPQLLDQLAHRHPILGNRGQSLKISRDPAHWVPCLVHAGVQVPEFLPGPANPGHDVSPLGEGPWLIKPYRSGGGKNIREGLLGQSIPQGYFAQKRISGTGVSLSFFLGPGGGRAFLGAYEMPNIPALAAPDFGYRGSVVFRGLPLVMGQLCQVLAKVLKEKMGLRGLVGVDAIRKDGQLWIIEINPRPTASMELSDPLGGANLARWHVAGFLGASYELEKNTPREKPQGKAILYAEKDFAFPGEFDQETIEKNFSVRFADIPQPLEPMGKGEPVLTILVEEPDPGRMIERIEAAVGELKKRFYR